MSSFFQFELLIKPLIYRLMGHVYKPDTLNLRMGATFERKKSDRLSLYPVIINSVGDVFPVEYHGSAHINALIGSDGFIFIPMGQTHICKGDIVNVRQI